MTTKLYLESIEAGYYQHFSAVVTEIHQEHVVLDRTLFYPLGGGQNWDTGTLFGPNGPVQCKHLFAVFDFAGAGRALLCDVEYACKNLFV